MNKKDKADRNMFFLAGALLAGPASYWFMFNGWTPGTTKVKVLIIGIQLLVGVYLFFYGLKTTQKK